MKKSLSFKINLCILLMMMHLKVGVLPDAATLWKHISSFPLSVIISLKENSYGAGLIRKLFTMVIIVLLLTGLLLVWTVIALLITVSLTYWGIALFWKLSPLILG